MANYTFNAGDVWDPNNDWTISGDTWTVNGTASNPVTVSTGGVFPIYDLTQNASDTGDDTLNATYFDFTVFNFGGGNDYASLTDSFSTNFDRDLIFGLGSDTAVLYNSRVGTVTMADDAASATETDVDTFTATDGSSIGSLSTGAGADVITLTDSIIRDSGNSLDTSTGSDSITITRSFLNGNLIAGDGDNTVTITDSSNIEGSITTTTGNDDITVSNSRFNGSINLGDGVNDVDLINVNDADSLTTGSGIDTVNIAGSSFSGSVSTGGSADVINITNSYIEINVDSGDGGDILTIDGLTGADQILTQAGNDTVTLSNSTLSEDVELGDGDDTITVTDSSGRDVEGGLGLDYIYIENSTMTGQVAGDIISSTSGGGADTIIIHNSSVDDDVHGGGGDDTLQIDNVTDLNYVVGGDGADIIDILNSTLSADVELGDGNDTVRVNNSSMRDVEGGEGEDYIQIENATLTGQVSGGIINSASGGGADTIVIHNSSVDDDVLGGGGDDTIQIDNVTDLNYVVGGDGADIIYIANSTVSVDVGGDVIGETDGAGHGDDTITVYNSTAEWIAGGGGDDDIFVHSSTALYDIWGGEGDDTINVFGSTANGVVAEAGDDIVILHDVILTGGNDIEGNFGSDHVYMDNVTRNDGSNYVKAWGGEDSDDTDVDILYISVPVDANGDMDYTYIRDNLEFSLWDPVSNPFGTGQAPDDANGTVVTNLGTLANGYDDGTGLMYSGVDLGGTYVTNDGLTIEFDEFEFMYFIPEVPDPLPPEPVIELTCFVRGALIETDIGPVAIQNLKLGDMIKTRDNGYQPLKWIGSSLADATDKHAPIKFAKGTIDNSRDMLFSPQHRILVSSMINKVLLGDTEALVPAKHFVNGENITIAYSETKVEYFHIMFERHEIILSSGVWSESFEPSDKNITAFDHQTRDEILELFPDLLDRSGSAVFGPSHYSTDKHESTVIVSFLN